MAMTSDAIRTSCSDVKSTSGKDGDSWGGGLSRHWNTQPPI
jgi:hypothetical protein